MQDRTTTDTAGLPSSKRLIRSTLIAFTAAVAILLTVVLPSQYGIDPIGVGRALGIMPAGNSMIQTSTDSAQQPTVLQRLAGLVSIRSASAQSVPAAKSNEISVKLKPGQGAEVKLVMKKGASAEFVWTVKGGVVNYDLHGDGGRNKKSYKRGRAVPSHKGTLNAAFDGNHGWFWRNRTKKDVTVTLRVTGDYAELKRVL